MTSHFYWVGAIPAMVFLGVFMMPFYYGSKARSVPEYLKLRFDEKTRGFNAISFAVMTVFSSGISMYAHGAAAATSAGLELQFQHAGLGGHRARLHLPGRPDLGHLQRSAAVLPDRLRLRCRWCFSASKTSAAGAGCKASWSHVATAQGFAPGALDAVLGAHGQRRQITRWASSGSAWSWASGFVLSFGYWCTDFLVVQRAMAANSMSAARRTPLIAAIPKMFFPFLVILPGMIAIALHPASRP